jgi:hypothetical protein
MLAIVFHIQFLLCWDRTLLFLISSGFYCEGTLNFVKGFFSIYWDAHVNFVWYYIYAVLHLLTC